MRSVIRLLQLNVALSAVLVVSGSPAFPHSVLSLETSASPVCASPAAAARVEARFFRSTAAISLPPLGEVSASIGPEGGAIATPDGLIDIKVPAGAVSEQVLVTLTGGAVDPTRTTYTVYEFKLTAASERDGSTLDQFDAPLTYTLSPPPGSIDPALLPSFSLLWFNPAGNYWYAVDSKADAIAGSLTAATPEVGRFELASDPLLTTGPNEDVVYPLEGGVVADDRGEVELVFSPGDTIERLDVSITPHEGCDQHPSAKHTVSEFQLDAVAIDRGDATVSAFSAPVELTLTYTINQLIALEPTSLKLYQLDESTGSWIEVPAQIEPTRGLIKASLDHFSVYSTQAESKIVFPPGNQYFQVDMSSGAATASIPIELPAGPGGFAPSLSLNYASSAVDEMKTSKTMASWVGAGWNLSVPMIIKDPFGKPPGAPASISGRYFLSMNGVYDLLVREDSETFPGSGKYRFHTKRETHMYIEGHKCESAAAPYYIYYEFLVRTKDGTEYEFGNTAGQWNCGGSDSLNFFASYWETDQVGWHLYHYRMSVSRIADSNGNTADFTYSEDIRTDAWGANQINYDRAAYPSGISWGANGTNPHVYKITFATGYDWDINAECGSGSYGQIRLDAPVDDAGTPNDGSCPSGSCPTTHFVPKVMDTRYLNGLTVQTFGGSTIRSYTFDYQNAARSHYNSCPVSGTLKLWKVHEKGKDGGELRFMEFGYENKAIGWETSGSLSCQGNPNEGAQSRPYLTTFKNGFGGEVTFTYERQWKDISGGCGWSRWVTNVRTVKPGQGQPDQVYDYEYPSNPQNPVYATPSGLANVMDAEFRGFPTVTLNLPGTNQMQCDFKTDEYLAGLTSQCRWYDGTTLVQQETNYFALDDACTTGTPSCNNWEPGYPSFSHSKFVRRYISDEYLTGRANRGTRFTYGSYGNITETCNYRDGYAAGTLDTQNACVADARLYRKTLTQFTSPNTADWIVDRPKQVDLKDASGTTVSSQKFYYDTQSFGVAPTKGLLTKVETLTTGSTYIETSVFNYDAYGNRTAEMDGVGDLTSTSYQCSNTQPYQVTAGGLTTTYAYNCVLGLPETVTGPDGVAYNIRYDEHGRRDYEYWPDNSLTDPTVNYTYEWNATLPNGTQIDRRETPAGGTPVTTLWEVSCVDGFGRVVQTRREMPLTSASVVDIAYDTAGNKAWESIPYTTTTGAACGGAGTASKTQYAYDVLGRVRSITEPGATSLRVIDYTGTKVKTTNERGYCTEQDVDSFGRTTIVREFKTTACTTFQQTAYFYDERDLLTWITDPAGNPTVVDYDKAGRKITLNDPDTGIWSYTYYNDGLLETQTDPRQIKGKMAYDSLGRMTRKQFLNAAAGDAQVAPDVVYTYDTCQINCPNSYSTGRLTMVQEWAETQKFRYDLRGRVETERHVVAGLTLDVARAYDSLDRLRTTTYPDGEVVTNTYDGGSIYSAIGASTYLESSTFNAAFLPEEFVLGNNLSLLYDYRNVDNKDFRLKNVRIRPSPPNLVDYTYEYDGVGNVTKVTDGTLTSGNIGTYSYDYADRLTDVNGLPDLIHYDYDAIGNMTKKTESPVTPNYTAADGLGGPGMFYGSGAPGPHALTSATSWVSGVSRAHTYEYDATGNMLREKMNGQVVHEFQYDAAGHVFFRRSEPFETNGYDYFYNNSDGTLVRRVKAGASAEDVIYIGDLYERKMSGGTTTVTKYYYADGRRIAMRTGSTLYFLAADHLGGTSVVMNAASSLVNRVRYYPFGNIRTQEGGTPVTDRLFTGQRRLSENGIYNYGARTYNATIGRFLQADAIVPGAGNPQALNRYSYVLNNPMRYTDPSGNCIPEMTCNGEWIDNGMDPGTRHFPPTGQPYPGPAPVSGSRAKCGTFDCPGGYPGWNSGILLFYAIEAGLEFTQLGSLWDATMFAITCGSDEGCDWTYAIGAAPILTSGMIKGAKAARAASVAAHEADLVPAGSIKVALGDWEHVLERHTAGGKLTGGKSVFSEGTDILGLVEQSSAVMPVPSRGNLVRTVDAGRIIGTDRKTGGPTSLYTVVTRMDGSLITAHPGRP